MARISFLLVCLTAVPRALAAEPPSPETVLVTVGGEPITEGQLQLLMRARGVPERLRPALRKRLLEQMIDRRLMEEYLAGRDAVPDPGQVAESVKRIRQRLGTRGGSAADLMARLMVGEGDLRRMAAVPLAWRVYIRRVVTDQQLREFFAKYHEQFDGTEVRARQIFVKLPEQAGKEEVRTAEERLETIRKRILAGETSFAEAAKKHSEAPSAPNGGDLGFFPYRGKMPARFSRAAFPLKKGEVSRPFRTRFGMHLITVTDRRPGQLALEDVRELVYNRLADRTWEKIVSGLRETAKIAWPAGERPGSNTED